MEHLNRLCKECITGLGANKTHAAITQIEQAMDPLKKILDNFDATVDATNKRCQEGIGYIQYTEVNCIPFSTA